MTYSARVVRVTTGASASALVAALMMTTLPTAHAAPTAPTTVRLSVAADGTQADAYADGAVISRDGRVAAFVSSASNLAPGDSPGSMDIFVRQLRTGSLQRVALTGHQLGTPSLSRTGGLIAYTAYDNSTGMRSAYVQDLRNGAVERLAAPPEDDFAAGAVSTPVLTANGRHVAFVVYRPAGSTADEGSRVYVRDRVTGTTERVSRPDTEPEVYYAAGPAISDDGQRVAYTFTTPIPKGPHIGHVFLQDRAADTEQIIDVAYDGTTPLRVLSSPSISGDGRRVLFEKFNAGPVTPDDRSSNMFVRDVESGTTIAIPGNPARPGTRGGQLSADGRHVAYELDADDPAAESGWAWPVAVLDLTTGKSRRVSSGTDGGPANGSLTRGAVSGNGRTVVFSSIDTDLVPEDTNALSDVFALRLR
ncbi:TolB family protein [Streptomyces sp. NPDC087263]|uniref:TolB family protein n=1 Tax=Streptomyces sp. NPDC087263 TaxID=3365773 RepID=UPI0037F9614A